MFLCRVPMRLSGSWKWHSLWDSFDVCIWKHPWSTLLQMCWWQRINVGFAVPFASCADSDWCYWWRLQRCCSTQMPSGCSGNAQHRWCCIVVAIMMRQFFNMHKLLCEAYRYRGLKCVKLGLTCNTFLHFILWYFVSCLHNFTLFT